MSAVVCQGLQSCLESQLIEARTLRLKLAFPISRPPFLPDNSNSEDSSNPDMGGWTFLQSLPNSSQNPKCPPENEIPYVHPTVKKPSSVLTDKSLELCTENLGSETGSDITESSDLSLPSLDTEGGKSPTREYRKAKNYLDFPPPLTIIGSSSLQIRPHREGGRLIIKAVEAPLAESYFQAERSHGRLRLCFREEKCGAANFDPETAAEENEEDSDMVELGHEENVDEEESDVDGTSLDVEGEMGMKKIRRPSWCKEGGRDNKSLYIWEPFLVATS